MAWVHWILADAVVQAELAVARHTWRALVKAYGGITGTRPVDDALRRLQHRGWIERRGWGRQTVFQVTAEGSRQAASQDPGAQWNRPWDGSWRAVAFDLPESRRKDRLRLWKALRAHKLGLLQRSVWIWPAPLELILEKVIAAEGIPECFCGFETRRIFLCTDAELVTTAWDFEEIIRRQRGYLAHPSAAIPRLKKADALALVAALGRSEWQAYEHAFALDPWLPRELWPAGYRGEEVQHRHRAFRRLFWQRLEELSRPANSVF